MNSSLIHPFYHTVSNVDLPHIWPLYKVFSKEEFIKQLEEFDKDFDFIDVEEILHIVLNKGLSEVKGKMFLSFDDGLKEAYTIIAPMLKEKGIPATFFVNPSFIDTSEVFYRYKVAHLVDQLQKDQIEQNKIDELKLILSESGKLKYTLEDSFLSMDYRDNKLIEDCLMISEITVDNASIYMSSKEITSLVEDGFSVGGHSMNHAHFSLLTEEEQLKEIKDSVDFCQERFRQKLRLFAFPFFDFDMPSSLYAKMYADLNIDLSFGTSGIKKDSIQRNIQRLDMEQFDGSISKNINREKWKYSFKKLFNKHIVTRS